jgi:hypothetical protein
VTDQGRRFVMLAASSRRACGFGGVDFAAANSLVYPGGDFVLKPADRVGGDLNSRGEAASPFLAPDRGVA